MSNLSGMITDLGKMKLDHMLEEFGDKKDEEIPIKLCEDDEFESSISSKGIDKSLSSTQKDWYSEKDWKMFTIQKLKSMIRVDRI